MKYSNMLFEELIKEAYYTDNELALEMVKQLDNEIENAKEETPIMSSAESYDEGYVDAVEEMKRKLEML